MDGENRGNVVFPEEDSQRITGKYFTTQYFIGDATHNDASEGEGGARMPGNQATGDRGGHPDDLELDHCPSHIDSELHRTL